MIRLDDALIDHLAHQESPRAYSHEIKYMAQEIFERRAAEKAAASQQSTASTMPGIPFPGGLYP